MGFVEFCDECAGHDKLHTSFAGDGVGEEPGRPNNVLPSSGVVEANLDIEPTALACPGPDLFVQPQRFPQMSSRGLLENEKLKESP